MINTIIFDMDGTVLNTVDDLTVSMNYVYEKFGMPSHTPEEYKAAFGSGVRRAFEQTMPEGTEDETVNEMLPVFKKHYDKHCLDKTAPYEGIIELMNELKEKGYKMAIVSNKIDSAVKELQDKFFDGVCDVALGEKDGVRRKPAPDMVEEAMKILGSTKEESLYIGDSEVDLQTAKNSDLPCIAVLWGFRTKEFLEEHEADCFAREPSEVAKILQQKNS